MCDTVDDLRALVTHGDLPPGPVPPHLKALHKASFCDEVDNLLALLPH